MPVELVDDFTAWRARRDVDAIRIERALAGELTAGTSAPPSAATWSSSSWARAWTTPRSVSGSAGRTPRRRPELRAAVPQLPPHPREPARTKETRVA
ncbi:hypothetical protein NKG94_34620 [Micromonospora sp. M12]